MREARRRSHSAIMSPLAGPATEISPDDSAADSRRPYYRITDAGQCAVGAQRCRLQVLIDVAQTKPLIAPGLA